MRRTLFIFVWMAWLTSLGAAPMGGQASGQASSGTSAAPPPVPPAPDVRAVDGVAVRIEDDILTESEVLELSEFQQLVDGEAKSRGEIIRELSDQWIVRSEAEAARYPQPSTDDVQNAYAALAKQFGSPEELMKRCTNVGLSEVAVRRLLAQQIYLSRFLDYRFRPAAQVDDKQIEKYYSDEFAPELRARSQAVPPLDDVDDTIREVLVQRAIDDRAKQWLDETRMRLKIDVVSEGERQ
jgi:hypothetical protein